MFAVYATHADPDNPLAALKIGDRPERSVLEGWTRVKISHASLNRHDLFTLRGITAHPEGITYPMILGNDAAGTLDDGTPVVIYPMMGSADWRGDETLDPAWQIPSEFIPGTFADYAVVPKRNAIPLPSNLSPLHVRPSGRPDGARPGRQRRHGDGDYPARPRRWLRGLGHQPHGRRSGQCQVARRPRVLSLE
jgi:D-arabinose 1-dehydrogenase-like Zn-dependent alcohol dehydrogenase